jgi:hypothetical protein
MSGKAQRDTSKRLEQTKRAYRRDGYNRGVRAAARLVGDCWVVGTASREQAKDTEKAILRLLKPSLYNPNLRIKI